MKIKEFLKNIEGINPETELSFLQDDGCCGDIFELGDLYEIDHLDLHKNPEKNNVSVRFYPYDFTASCIGSSAAKQAGNSRPLKYEVEKLNKIEKICKNE